MVTLIACEGALRVAAVSSRAVHGLLMPPEQRDDPTLASANGIPAGNPYHPEHDQAGYRNANRPEQADVVVLGDSQAYGSGVPRDEAWPARLGAYNMALPGYGPGHILLQIDQALALHPREVIVAVYFGNDFADTFWLSSSEPALLADIDPDLRRAAEEARRRGPIVSQDRVIVRGDRSPPSRFARAATWAADHVKILGLFRAAWAQLTAAPPTPLLSRDFEQAAGSLDSRQRELAEPVSEEGWRTILTPDYRGRVVDERDPRIRLGFEISLRAISAIRERTRAANASLLLVLIPTKESVFWPRGRANAALQRLVANESRLREDLVASLQAQDIPYIDMLPVLRSADAQPYFEDVDGHPNAAGHRLIADAVAACVRPDQRLTVAQCGDSGASSPAIPLL